MEPLTFTCPRCLEEASAEFYGPCPACVAVLRSVGGQQVEVAEAAYTPKMNVTPNFVATKD